MRFLCFILLMLTSYTVLAQDSFQLAPPIVRYSSLFYKKSAKVRLEFNQPQTQIYYTTDGSEPSLTAPRARKHIYLAGDRVQLKALSAGKGFIPSKVVSVVFAKTGYTIKAIETSPTNPKYPGTGSSLFDAKSGTGSHQDSAWKGFDSDSISFTIEFVQPRQVHTVSLHVLENQAAWIFLPKAVSIYSIDKNGIETWETSIDINATEQHNGATGQFIDIKLPRNLYGSKIKVVAAAVTKIPEWHDGKGLHAWFFIDEINVY